MNHGRVGAHRADIIEALVLLRIFHRLVSSRLLSDELPVALRAVIIRDVNEISGLLANSSVSDGGRALHGSFE